MSRLAQTVLIITTLLSAWLLMQVVHELGHVLAGYLTGGEVRLVVLHPLEISRTDLGANPSPLIVCWAGPLFGAVAPLAVWALANWRRTPCAFWLQFFTGFCLIANGAYLAVGVNEGIGDAGDLMKFGSPAGLLYLFGAVTIPAGLWMWNGLGRSFGLGQQANAISWRTAWISTSVLAATIIIELVFSRSK